MSQSVVPLSIPSVIRSDPKKLVSHYREYREELRVDFWYSCAYCSLTEIEAGGVRFTIDHFHPVSDRPELELSYSNLLWCCDHCNSRKSDLRIPSEALLAGFRFYRPDEDAFADHFRGSTVADPEDYGQFAIVPVSPAGQFTVEMLLLNSKGKRDIRALRQRLYESEAVVLGGLRELTRVRLDRINPRARTTLQARRKELSSDAKEMSECLTELVQLASRAPLVDVDPEHESLLERRRQHLHSLRAVYPGRWRGREAGD